MKLKSLLGAAVIAGTLISGTVMSSVAGAAPEPSGWDDVNDAVVGAGSDTTYPFMQRYELLYNQANGCDTNNASPAAPPVPFTLGNCLTGAAQGATQTQGNWDHDYFAGFYPTGSSAGVKALQNSQVDYARSSRGPRASGETDLNFWAFAKDGLVMITMGNRPTGNLTKAQIQGIYNCTITDWSQIPGQAAGTIEPVGMNPSSGTKASMDTYLGFDANQGACKKSLDNATFPFENDVKPVLEATGINENNAIWWMSFAEFRAFGYKRQTAQTWTVDNVGATPGTIANNSYPITRFIYHVTKDAITAPAGSSDLTGDDGGKQGAVREFTEFLCKPAASHIANDYSGKTNYVELTSIYSATGFIRLPAGEQTNGICRLVPG
jgi:ABC-type phosphate transport system substrate-binding protein